MKKNWLSAVLLLSAISLHAQKDSSAKQLDTLQIGGFTIVRDGEYVKASPSNSRSNYNQIWVSRSAKKNKPISTNWLIFDLGFTNYRDLTNYSYAQAGSYLKIIRPGEPAVNEGTTTLNTGKSSNVNIWLFAEDF